LTIPQSIVVYGIIAGLSTCVGIGVLIWKEQWARAHTPWLNSFAAGVVLAVVFWHLLPEAVEATDLKRAMTFVVAGFIIFYLLENVMIMHGSAELGHPDCDQHPQMYARSRVAGMGLFVHSLIDGIIIGVGFDISTEIGLIATLGIIMHEFPEGIAIQSVLYDSGMKRRNALLYSLAVAFATPVGAVAFLPFLGSMSPATVGALLAVGAGTFLYVAASDLIPAAHSRGGKFNALLFLGGVAFLRVTALMLEHGRVH